MTCRLWWDGVFCGKDNEGAGKCANSKIRVEKEPQIRDRSTRPPPPKLTKHPPPPSPSTQPAFTKAEKLSILDRLAWSDLFEHFLANKYTAAKRFGLEGAESLIPGMKALIDRAADMGVENIVIGMPHRGRLNVLGNVVRKPLSQIFCEFSGTSQGSKDPADYTGSGDVKYHLGTSFARPTSSGRRVYLSLVANPSHLEAVNTVVLGKTRAKQYFVDDLDRTRCMPILLHGDGAFSGQGIVYETLDMSGLVDYTVGGCVHLVVNNQVAFTTDPKEGRSSPYCTDVAKSLVSSPIFHVNGDDVEAVVRVCMLAAEWRQTYKTDVVVDLVCYRKHGHNEIDEPMFTQPLMYKKIKTMKNSHRLYVDQLLKEGSVTEAEVKAIHDKVLSILDAEFAAAKDYKPKPSDWLASHWTGFKSPAQMSRIRNTGVPHDMLLEVGKAITTLPADFTPHRQIKKVYETRRAMIEGREPVDWAFAEALAFSTLLAEGNHVRLSGQDVERGTFSHRHALLHDQSTGARHAPMAHVFPGQKDSQFTVSNSSLSEFGVLGFELGYSLENPNSLVLWEAQFGDFANSAQIIFDQFLSSGEAKWLRQSGLVCLLPHGYDGQGPEHSSARLERFLQMSDENPFVMPAMDESQWFTGGHLGTQVQSANWQVVNVTTPANYFHVLRRQVCVCVGGGGPLRGGHMCRGGCSAVRLWGCCLVRALGCGRVTRARCGEGRGGRKWAPTICGIEMGRGGLIWRLLGLASAYASPLPPFEFSPPPRCTAASVSPSLSCPPRPCCATPSASLGWRSLTTTRRTRALWAPASSASSWTTRASCPRAAPPTPRWSPT